MTQTAGRDVLGGLVVLLRDTLLTGPTEQRLLAILRQSRRFQNEVSSELAEQVMSALGDLLGGFQAARVLSGEALALPLAGGHPRRGAGAPAPAQPGAGGRGGRGQAEEEVSRRKSRLHGICAAAPIQAAIPFN